MFNNLVLGTTSGARFGISSDSEVDYNGFNRNSPYGGNGIRLSLPIFIQPSTPEPRHTNPYTLPGVIEQ